MGWRESSLLRRRGILPESSILPLHASDTRGKKAFFQKSYTLISLGILFIVLFYFTIFLPIRRRSSNTNSNIRLQSSGSVPLTSATDGSDAFPSFKEDEKYRLLKDSKPLDSLPFSKVQTNPQLVQPNNDKRRQGDSDNMKPVSYTHLTLPTIYSV